MRFTSTIATAALFTGALAQIPNGVLQLVSNLSPQCQQTVFGLIQSPVVECLNLAESINIISQFTSSSASNTSIAVPIDQLLALECASAGCSNATLTSLAQNITSGCGTDLESYGISTSNVTFAIAQYPLVREVVCLRTSDLETDNGTSIAEEPSYNVTNGTAYCATTLLATVEDKIDANLTIPFFMDIYRSYQNGSLDQSEYLSNFTQEDLCDECIFAAADVIGVAYPGVGNLTLTSLGFGQNVSDSAANTTLAQALDSTCAAEGLQWTSNGTLPANITLGAANSTFGFNLTAGNETYEPEETSPIVKRNVADIKARWIGQY